MKRKFEEFNDGIVDIYGVGEDDRLEKVKSGLRFGKENVSIARHYAARATDTNIDCVIHIQLQKDIQPHQIAVIEGRQYDIDKTDSIKDALPPVTKLSLVKFEKHREKEFA